MPDFIKNKEGIPDTHFFIYKNKKYPIKFDFFKYASKYFEENQHKFESTKEIKLIDEEPTAEIPITDHVIHNFIDYVQCKKVPLSNDNAIGLNYLSSKYEVNTLEEITREYISTHQSELVLEIIERHQNDSKFDTARFEEMISNNMMSHINDDRLLHIKVSILHRILMRFKTLNRNEYEINKVNDFLIKYHEIHGKESSVLFSILGFGTKTQEYISLLINKYSTTIDFEFICDSLVETIKEMKDEIEKLRKEMIEIKNINSTQKSEICKLNNELERKDQINNELQVKLTKIIQEKDTEITSQKQNLMNELNELKNQIKKQEKQINEFKRKESGIPLLLNQNDEFNGIIKYLTKKTGGNIHNLGKIIVTSNTIQSNYKPENLLDFNCNSCYYANQANNAWICFDFKEMRVKITNYSIKSFSNYKNGSHLKCWKIETSNDNSSWIEIDDRVDCPTLNGYQITGTFDVISSEYSRYVRLRQTSATWSGGDCYLGLHYIEFYGYLIE